MMIVAVALILGVLLGGFILISGGSKSGQTEVCSNASDTKELRHNSIASQLLSFVQSIDLAQHASRIYGKREVSLHNKRTDCWIIIKDKVYDVTSYVEEHPGGDAILAHAGDDSTEGFFGPQHATRVFDMIDDFYIGDLEQ